MTIYYFDGNIIGRSSGRSSVGAAAYRSGEKLRSHAAGSAAYMSGGKLRDEEGEIVHDYTRKTGVRHSEIMLPKDAPPEFVDRETLWNAVERAEKRKDAQLAREIIIAQQREFDLQEQIEILREYVKENFTDKGMCADFAIHDKKDGNPHAHIMLTFRDVTPDGFGLKNTAWNDRDLFLEWRKGWADVNNRMFERKGLEQRIDYRSYKSRGIDREPMVHLGYEAAALEKKGVKTERGNHNREVQKRNAQRKAQKEEKRHEPEKTEQTTEELGKIEKETKLENELQKIREVPKTAQYMENPIESDSEPPFVSALEKQLKAEKAMQYIEKMQEQQNSAEQTAKRMNALQEKYIELEKEKITLIDQHNKDKHELPPLEYRAELIEEHAENIVILQGRLEQLRESRQNLRMFDLKKKKETDEKIAQVKQDLGWAQDFFKNRFNVDPSQSHEELKRLQEKIRIKKEELKAKQIIVQAIKKKQEKLELEYHTQKLINETRPDNEEISHLLEQMRKPPQSVREQQLQERIERQLNVVGEHGFQKVTDNLPPYQAHILTNIREQAKERQRLKEIQHAEKEHSRTFGRSR